MRTTACCVVHWGSEHAEWQVMDSWTGTNMSVEALLYDVAR